MRVLYNGVEISVATLHTFAYEAVYSDDGVDYLYSRVELICSGVINGQAELQFVAGPPISYREMASTDSAFDVAGSTPPGLAVPAGASLTPSTGMAAHEVGAQPVGSPLFPPGGKGIYSHGSAREILPRVVRTPVPTPVSHRAIRKMLMEPRCQLFVFAGDGDPSKDEILLNTPGYHLGVDGLPDYALSCDCRNGPTPKIVNVTACHGDAASLMVDFHIEAFCNEQKVGWSGFNYDFGINTSPLLSNRFSCTHHIADDQFLEIHTEGVAIFRTDRLYAGDLAINPDSYRCNLMLPVPFGFVRGDIVVEGISDGSGVRYSFVDRQQKVNFPAGPYARATSISAIHRQAVVLDQNVLEGALTVYDRGVSSIVNNVFAFPEKSPLGKAKKKKKPRRPPPSP